MGTAVTESVKDMPGIRKAAILLLALDQDASTRILMSMPAKSVETVTRELASLGGAEVADECIAVPDVDEPVAACGEMLCPVVD